MEVTFVVCALLYAHTGKDILHSQIRTLQSKIEEQILEKVKKH